MREHAVLLGAPASPHAWRLGMLSMNVLLDELTTLDSVVSLQVKVKP